MFNVSSACCEASREHFQSFPLNSQEKEQLNMLNISRLFFNPRSSTQTTEELNLIEDEPRQQVEATHAQARTRLLHVHAHYMHLFTENE